MQPVIARRRSTPYLRHAGGCALAALAAFATLALAAPAAEAHSPQIRVDQRSDAPLKIIALKARVTDLDRRTTLDYEMVPAEHVQLLEGDRVRLGVVGTAIVDGRGVEHDVPVRLELAAGSRYVDVTRHRDGSVIVATQPIPAGEYGGDGLVRAQLAYDVVGNYDLRDNLRSGRITFEIRPARGAAAPITGGVRWDHAAAIAGEIAEVGLTGEGTPNWVVERIWRDGYQGARDSALELAVQTERTGVLRRQDPNRLLAHLYRHLLGRSGSDRDVQAADPQGFAANLGLYQREGYRKLVEVFVNSDEFRRHHDFASLERLPMPRDDRPGPDRRRAFPRGGGIWY